MGSPSRRRRRTAASRGWVLGLVTVIGNEFVSDMPVPHSVVTLMGGEESVVKNNVMRFVGGTGDARYLRRVEAACRDAGVAFDYLGEISPGSLAATYQQCDVYAMTSRSLPGSGWPGRA